MLNKLKRNAVSVREPKANRPIAWHAACTGTGFSVGHSGDVAEAARQMMAPRRIPLPCGDIVSEGLLWTPTRIPSRTGALCRQACSQAATGPLPPSSNVQTRLNACV